MTILTSSVVYWMCEVVFHVFWRVTNQCVHFSNVKDLPCFDLLDDSTDVGEEDSFLGQISENGPGPSTFNYFSSPVTSSDPFASIGQSPRQPTVAPTAIGPVSVPSGVGMAPAPPPGSQMNPAIPPFGSTVYQNPMGRQSPPPATMTPPPPLNQPLSHNPYRHTPTSSRASPYIPAPEILPSTLTPQQNPYSLSSPPQMLPLSGPAFSKVHVSVFLCQILHTLFDLMKWLIIAPVTCLRFCLSLMKCNLWTGCCYCLLSLLPHRFMLLYLQPALLER